MRTQKTIKISNRSPYRDKSVSANRLSIWPPTRPHAQIQCASIWFKTLIRTRRYRRTLIRSWFRSRSCPPPELPPQGVPDPRQTHFHPASRTTHVPDCKRPVRIRAARDPDCNSSRSTISCSRLQPQSVRVQASSCSACVQLAFLPSSRFILLVVRFQQSTKTKGKFEF